MPERRTSNKISKQNAEAAGTLPHKKLQQRKLNLQDLKNMVDRLSQPARRDTGEAAAGSALKAARCRSHRKGDSRRPMVQLGSSSLNFDGRHGITSTELNTCAPKSVLWQINDEQRQHLEAVRQICTNQYPYKSISTCPFISMLFMIHF